MQKQTHRFHFDENIKGPNNISLDHNHLNKPFNVEEIKKWLKKLKAKKAPGIDSITSDILKCSSDELLKIIRDLFNKRFINLILDTGYYPENWNFGIIPTLYKSGPRSDPSNYRGIT